MDEKYIQDLYNQLGGQAKFGNFADFKNLMQNDPSYQKDFYNSFGEKTLGSYADFESLVKKKNIQQSAQPQTNPQSTTESSSEGTSSDTSREDDGILSKAKNLFIKSEGAILKGALDVTKSLGGLASAAWTEGFLKPADYAINAVKNSLRENNFFGEDIPDTDKPMSDAFQKKLEESRKYDQMSPIDPRRIMKGIGNLTNIIINSTLSQEQKNAVINRLTAASNNIKGDISNIEEYQKKVAPTGVTKYPYEITKNIVGMAPDLILAAAMENPQAVESAAAKWTTKTTEKAAPIVKKYAPKAAQVIEESIRSPFTKIMATKGALKGMAETEEGENPYVNAVYGGLEGMGEGMYMHGLGMVAGKTAPPVSKAISKITGANSAIATAVALPLANAGVFTTAKALRTAATEQRMITPEEAIMEAGTGIGFSLLHLGSVYKNQNEANHYYDNVLKDNPKDAFVRVINETKPNLDIAYVPDLTDAEITKLKEARDELKKAILSEPDMKKKMILGDEAVKIQNQLDAHSAINGIVANRDAIIDVINSNNSYTDAQKKMLTDKVSAIADSYDMSDYGVKKRDLNEKIDAAYKDLSDLSDAFTNMRSASDRAETQQKIDAKRKELDDLNGQMNELIKTKTEQDAIQKQAADEALLRAGEQKLGLQGVGEGNAKLEITPEQSQAIADEKDAFQEILDNPTEHDETDVQEAKDYFANPVKYYEEKIKFYEDEPNPTEDDKAVLEHFKSMLEAHKAAEVKTEPTTITVGAGGATTTTGGATEVTGAEAPETMTGGVESPKVSFLINEFYKNPISFLEKYFKEKSNLMKIALASANVKNEILKNQKDLYDNIELIVDGQDLTKNLKDLIYPSDVEKIINNKDEFLKSLKTRIQQRKNKAQSSKDFTNPYGRVSKTGLDSKQVIDDYLNNKNTRFTNEQYEFAKSDFDLGLIKYIENGDVSVNLKNNAQAYSELGIKLDVLKGVKDGYSPEQLMDIVSLDKIKSFIKKNNLTEKVSDTEAPAKTKTTESITIGAGGGVGVAEGKTTEVTGAEAPETKTSGVDGLPKYEETMGQVDFLVPKSKEYVEKDLKKAKDRYKIKKTEENKKKLDKAKADYEEYKTDVESKKAEAMDLLVKTETYKAADQIQKDALAREVAKRFGEKQARSPKPEELFGNVEEAKKIMEELNFLFDDANKSKNYLQGEFDKLKAEYNDENTSDKRKAKIKEEMKKLKSEIEEYSTKNIGEAITYLRNNSTTYREASKERREAMDNYIKDKFLKSQKENLLPSELFSEAKDITKVTITEKQRWKDQLSAFFRGIKNQAEATKAVMKEVAAKVSELANKGSITAKQAAAIVKRMSTIKAFDKKSTDKFTDYVAKVFADAEYDNKLSKANDLRKSISKLSSDKAKNAQLRDMCKKFIKLKPSMVEDIDTYIDMASKIRESIKGSKVGDEKEPLRQAEMVKIQDVLDYLEPNLEAQRTTMQEELAAQILEELGIDTTGMSMKEMEALLEKDENKKKYETIIKDKIKQIFDTNSAIIKEIFDTGKDPFTGEDMDFTDEQKKLVSRFMGMDVSLLKPKEAAEAVDALSNFLQNGSTAKMETVVRRYQGERNTEIALDRNLVASKLKFYNSKWLGEVLGEQMATLPMLEEMLFKGQSRAAMFNDLSGIRELMNAKTFVQKKSNDITNKYADAFYKREANGKSFQDQSNITERGILASVRRTINGTPEQQQAEFLRKKALIEKSIDRLKVGTEKEKELAKVYQEAYDKVLKDSENYDDVASKSDKNNVEAVDFWVKEWADTYDQLANVSENVYNKLLDKDIAYTPDRYTLLFGKGKDEPIDEEESLFHANSGKNSLYQKKTGVLEDIQRSTDLPKNKDGKEARYLDLSFDKNMANSMHDALMDVNTAAVIKQINAFMTSDNFDKIVPSAEDRDILKNSVRDFVRAARNKQIVETSAVSNAIKRLNAISSIGTATALGNLSSVIKQTAPVALNTLINTKGKLDLNFFTGPKADFMDRIGYGISVRGLESRAEIKSINRLVDVAANSTGQKAVDAIEKATGFWIKQFLEKPDVYIARASWISYYERALEKQGIDPESIDYSKHEVNKEAADYAQRMVDRQQNISDRDLSGKLFRVKDPGKKTILNMLMPFASFRMNQFMRATNDLGVIMSKDKSIPLEDREAAARSMAGYGAEMAMFKLLSIGLSIGMGSLTNMLIGKDETDEEYEKRKSNIVRAQATGTVTDVFSPLPPLDIAYAYGADKLIGLAQDAAGVDDKEKFTLVTSPKTNDISRSFGTFGITAKKVMDLTEIMKLAATGEYKDEYGRTKYISDDDRETLKMVGAMSTLSVLGLLPGDANTIAKNAMYSVKKDSSTKEGGKEGAEKEKSFKRNIKERQKSEANADEIEALNKMLEDETDKDKIDAINNKIDELSSPYYKTKEEKDARKLESERDKKEMDKLLQGYDNKTEMKRYDPDLYEQTFGEGSKYYEEHKSEMETKSEMNKTKTEIEDEERGYIKPRKKKKNKNSDGSYKKLYYKSTYSSH